MRVPERLGPLVEQGVIEEVLRPLMAGKEAQIFLVQAGGRVCVAKVYKEANDRSFKHRADYVEGRHSRNSRSERAVAKKSKFGREQMEAAWRSAEVDAIYRLRAAGVRVPEPYEFIDGVLLMELVMDEHGDPAPRLVDVELTEEEALWVLDRLIRDIVKMLCAGLVHGDLSDFNVLIAWDGPVIIDFPQAVDPAHNNNASRLFIRDVDNLVSFLTRFAPEVKGRQYGKEIWDLYERGVLLPDSPLTGKFKGSDRKADTNALLREIEAVEREAMARREALGLAPPRRARAPVEYEGPPPRPISAQPEGGRSGDGPRGGRGDRPARPEGRREDPPRRDERPARAEGRREDPPRRDERPARAEGRREDPPRRDERPARAEAPRGEAPRGGARDDRRADRPAWSGDAPRGGRGAPARDDRRDDRPAWSGDAPRGERARDERPPRSGDAPRGGRGGRDDRGDERPAWGAAPLRDERPLPGARDLRSSGRDDRPGRPERRDEGRGGVGRGDDGRARADRAPRDDGPRGDPDDLDSFLVEG
jgi:RIO kinase 1